MKEYRLKDQELQRKLDEISGGDFSKRLNDTADVWANNPDIVSIAWETGLGKQTLFKVWIPRSDIEEVPQYDPTKWNEWPDVEPPEGVDMRAEVLSKDGKVFFKGAGYFKGGDWNIAGRWIDSDRRVRFRPWDDTTSTLSKKMLQEIVTALESHPEAYELGYLIDAVDEAVNELSDEEDGEDEE